MALGILGLLHNFLPLRLVGETANRQVSHAGEWAQRAAVQLNIVWS